MKSKRKTLNGCCQMCIKTVKMTQKREKPQGGTSMEAWSTKKWSWREWRRWSSGSLTPCRPNFVVISPMPLIFTKLPLWAAKLQKCHSGSQMLAHSLCWRGNDMEMMWKWCGDSLQLNIDVQAPKLLHPNT